MPKVLSDAEIQDFRHRMLFVAERAFAEQGIEGVSMRQLAQQLGCSAMTPYRYFRGRRYHRRFAHRYHALLARRRRA